MTTVQLTYNENDKVATKAFESLKALGLFEIKETMSTSKKKNLKAIDDARKGKNITKCETFEDYLKAVSE